ncbi:MAG: FecR family protein [Mucilaginibacter sp.]|nr:FecR family protein [Mucilaginibacter sp.]
MKQDMSEDILIKYILGEASSDEAQEIETWTAASNANAKKFEEVKIILETSKRLAQVSPLDEVEAWEKFKEKRATKQQEPAKVISINRNTAWLRIAVAVIFLIGGGWIAYHLYDQSANSTALVSIRTANSVRTDTLPDGSVVHLNRNTSISYTGNFKSRREIKLTGEAFFEVKHNEQVPFTVHVNDITVRDIGTAFNIKSKQQNTEVIVESGIVQVSKATNSVRLTPNEMVRVKHGDTQLKVEQSPDMLYNYYRSKVFNVTNTPLWRVVKLLNDAYGTDIKIENKGLLNVPITLPINWDDPVGKVLEAIKETTPGIHIDKTDNYIVIK